MIENYSIPERNEDLLRALELVVDSFEYSESSIHYFLCKEIEKLLYVIVNNSTIQPPSSGDSSAP